MYAVVRAGGKQYRVAAGDIVRIEKTAAPGQTFDFAPHDILAVSPEAGKIVTSPSGATVTAQVVDQGRAAKIIVFKFKRKKQYKKTIGHRQSFSAVRILEISFGGQKTSVTATEHKEKKVPHHKAKSHAKAGATVKRAAARSAASKASGKTKSAAKPHAKKAAAKKPVAKSVAKKSAKKK